MYVKITSVAALPDYILLVGFATDEYKQFDMKPIIEKDDRFKALATDAGLFEQVKIDGMGYALKWNDALILSVDGIYDNGTEYEPINDSDVYKQKLIDQLTQARKDAGLSQKQLEILSGIPQSGIARTEKGACDPQITTVLKMLSPLGLTLTVTKK